MTKAKDFFSEVRRRKVLKATVIYAAIAWVAIQVVVAVFPTLGLPDWITRLIVILILAGLPVAVVLSWIFDVNPDKLRLDVTGDSTETVPKLVQDFGALIDIPAPTPASAIIGRSLEIDEVTTTLRTDIRLATITGPGGTGKTRLAVEVAKELKDDFPGGFAFVQLSPVTDPAMVMTTIARVLDVHEAEGRSDLIGIATLVGERRVLFILDNFEQVIDAAPDVSELLAACPNLKILVTSRAPLRIAGEREFNLHPLATPNGIVSVADLMKISSVELFVDRASMARAG
ncbi:MAG: hypothetical protein HKN43_09360, partial [Rhodothermales bacterium]|nr:hypothetical protein [Rhodothermales bacterium]